MANRKEYLTQDREAVVRTADHAASNIIWLLDQTSEGGTAYALGDYHYVKIDVPYSQAAKKTPGAMVSPPTRLRNDLATFVRTNRRKPDFLGFFAATPTAQQVIKESRLAEGLPARDIPNRRELIGLSDDKGYDKNRLMQD